MRIQLIAISIFLLIICSCKTEQKHIHDSKIEIEWSPITDNFSFKEKWSYPEFVYVNSFGQLSCDGDCPKEIDAMKNKQGMILKDSLEAFYKVIDTTHISYSLKSEAKMYELFQANFMAFKKLKNGTIEGYTIPNVSTHSTLHLVLDNSNCSASVNYNSIRDLGTHNFPLKNGKITIDPALYKSGIIKAIFDFKFENTIDPNVDLFWKGQIYSKIE